MNDQYGLCAGIKSRTCSGAQHQVTDHGRELPAGYDARCNLTGTSGERPHGHPPREPEFSRETLMSNELILMGLAASEFEEGEHKGRGAVLTSWLLGASAVEEGYGTHFRRIGTFTSAQIPSRSVRSAIRGQLRTVDVDVVQLPVGIAIGSGEESFEVWRLRDLVELSLLRLRGKGTGDGLNQSTFLGSPSNDRDRSSGAPQPDRDVHNGQNTVPAPLSTKPNIT